MVTARAAVLEPTVRVQLTLTCCAALVLVTVTVGLANARYDAPPGSESVVMLVGEVAVVGTGAVLLLVPNSKGSAGLHLTFPSRSIVPIALPAPHVSAT